ncbi:MAG: hypothetical protein JW776_10720 [Candidatus Lokiarchaeota archaeon]|nr:hypothetical protein [Candidatus Lokiarchaeota archaeon]
MSEDRSFLASFIENLQNFENLTRKTLLFPIMDKVRRESYHSNHVFSSIGEDAAGIIFNENSQDLLLITTDSITEEFSKKSPWAAGFSAIMAGADDIYSCGGTPIAASSIISSDQPEIRTQLLNGLLEATHRFEIPLVRGHTSDKTSNVGVSATVIGKIKKEDYVSAGGARNGDLIVVIADFDGHVGKSSKYYWDTVTFKEKDEILRKRKIMSKLAHRKLVSSSKDISNGGIIGTLILLLQYSKKGAVLDLGWLKTPPHLITKEFQLVEFVKMYLTSAFLVTVRSSDYKSVQKLGKEHGLMVFKIGKITENLRIMMKFGNLSQEFIDLTPYV